MVVGVIGLLEAASARKADKKIGENDTSLREKVCEGLGFLGIEIDKQLNDKARGGAEMKVAAISIFSIFAVSRIQQKTPNHLLGKVMAYTAAITLCAGKTEVWVIPTNEELLIARDTRDLVQ